MQEVRETPTETELGDRAPTLPARDGSDPMIDLVVAVAVTALRHVTAAAVSVVERDGATPHTVGASSPAALALEEIQCLDGVGPGTEAVRSGREVLAVLPCHGWPGLSRAAEGAGIHGVWTLPLTEGTFPAGTLTLYSSSREPWPPEEAATARLLAAQAALALAEARQAWELARGNSTLREALETRTVIGQAQGMIMAREDMDAAAAFDVMRRASQRTNRKLRDIATELVTGAGRPVQPGTGTGAARPAGTPSRSESPR